MTLGHPLRPPHVALVGQKHTLKLPSNGDCLTAVTYRRLGRMARGALFPGLSAIFCKNPSCRTPNPNDKQTPILQKFQNPHTPRSPVVRPTTTPPPRRSDPQAVNRDAKGKKRSANSHFCRCFSATYQPMSYTQST